MIITSRRKYFLRILEVYFADRYLDKIPEADVVCYLQIKKGNYDCREFNTLHIDLHKDEETIFSEMRKQNRQKIRKVCRDNDLNYCLNDCPNLCAIKRFGVFYDCFAQKKGIRKCNTEKLSALIEQNALVISSIQGKDDVALSCLAYVVDGQRARALYSASVYLMEQYNNIRNHLAMVNIYHHWLDIKYFKSKKYAVYDLGGLTLFGNDQEKKNIDNFKRGFGGSIVTEYNCYQSKTLLGALALFLFK